MHVYRHVNLDGICVYSAIQSEKFTIILRFDTEQFGNISPVLRYLRRYGNGITLRKKICKKL